MVDIVVVTDSVLKMDIVVNGCNDILPGHMLGNQLMDILPNGLRKPFPAPFDHNMYVILNLAVGGVWPGPPDEATDFARAAFEVDYVRVYRKTRQSMEEL